MIKIFSFLYKIRSLDQVLSSIKYVNRGLKNKIKMTNYIELCYIELTTKL